MADGNHLKIADQVDLADDDPFAELTRIMGFDPRKPAKPAAPEEQASQPSPEAADAPEASVSAAAPVEAVGDDDDFNIDLEKELMGEFVADDQYVGAVDDAPVEAARGAAAKPYLSNAADEIDIDFDFTEGFEAAIAEAAEEDPEPDVASEADEAGEEAQLTAGAEAAPVTADVRDDDLDIAAEFDAAMADIDMDFTPVTDAVQAPAADAVSEVADAISEAADAGSEKEAVAAVQGVEDDAGAMELRLLEGEDLHLDGNEFRVEADELHAEEDDLHLDEEELQLDDSRHVEADQPRVEADELSFDDVDFGDALDATAPAPGAVELEEPELSFDDVDFGNELDAAAPAVEEPELSFDDVDFGDEFHAVADGAVELEEPEPSFDDIDFGEGLDAAAPVAGADLEESEEATPVPAFLGANAFARYEPAEPKRDEAVERVVSPMDAAAAEYREREADSSAGPSDFNLEDELNALLGNYAPAKAPVADVPLIESRNEADAGSTAVEEPFEDMDWGQHDKLEAAAAPESVEDELPEEVYAEDDASEEYVTPEEYVEDDLPEIDAQSFDADMSAAMEVDDGYESAASQPAATKPYEAPVFERSVFDTVVTPKFDAGRASDTFGYRPDDAAARYHADTASMATERLSPPRDADIGARQPERYASPHRDPVVRGDPLKEDPLDVIAALTAKYSKPLPSAPLGRVGNATAPTVAAMPVPPRQLAEIQDDGDGEIDFGTAFDDAPEVETVEVADRAVALPDDLDIPELADDEDLPPVSAYDDLDFEFTNLLSDMNTNEPTQQHIAAHAASAYDDDTASDYNASASAYPADGRAAAPAADARHASTIPVAYDDAPDQYAFDADDLPGSRAPTPAQYAADDYDPDLDDPISVPDMAAAESRRAPQRRGMLVAAIVGGVALVGGLGAFALSFGDGSGTDTPVIVKADDSPVKVKPTNPGGTTVPNQDNKVYDTVAGEEPTAEPQQEKLVTTTEEPVDVTPPEEPADEMASGAAPKGEERIEQILQEAEKQTDAEIVAVAPRKVRTMVVKPDGTLVPREDPEPGVAAAPEAQPDTLASAQETLASPEATGALPAVPDTMPDAPLPGSEAPAAVEAPASSPAPVPEMQAAVEPATGAEPAPAAQETTNTPETAPIAPLRPADQPIDVVGEVKADQVAVAATAAGNSWSMQIASQPSEAAAQSSYQDLARRYGSVLEGREVNIVKAEIAGKGTFWRVRVPAKSRNEAISLCENYKASGGNCFVSR